MDSSQAQAQGAARHEMRGAVSAITLEMIQSQGVDEWSPGTASPSTHLVEKYMAHRQDPPFLAPAADRGRADEVGSATDGPQHQEEAIPSRTSPQNSGSYVPLKSKEFDM